jgi:predicted Zn-dependent protease with MMP-like domain
MAYRVSKDDFARLVEEALADVPPPFDDLLEEVAIEIRDYPTRQQLQSVELEVGDLLLGLYTGRPRTERSVLDGAVLPDTIQIYQKNIEAVCDSEADLIEQVRTTVLHEIGHHFGMSEEDLDELGYG